MTASTVGILLSIFALAFAGFIYWGGFTEQKRGNENSKTALGKLAP